MEHVKTGNKQIAISATRLVTDVSSLSENWVLLIAYGHRRGHMKDILVFVVY
jgi:hypothetical protein